VAVFGQTPDESYLVRYLKDGKESSLFARLGAAELAGLASNPPGATPVGLDKTTLESTISRYRQAGYRVSLIPMDTR
jgi:hypothetical protein